MFSKWKSSCRHRHRSKAKRVTPAANPPPKLSTLKNYSSSRRAAVTSATAVSHASLLRLKQAAASKKTILPSSVPHPHAQGNNLPDFPFGADIWLPFATRTVVTVLIQQSSSSGTEPARIE
jgi:hypothetical protein